MRAVYPGTFDPFTLGHLDIAVRAARIFEKVYVAVAEETGKNALPAQQRAELARLTLENAGATNIEVKTYGGLTTDFALKNACLVIVRGVRDGTEADHEKRLAAIFKSMGDFEVITLFGEKTHISGSIVRQLIRAGASLEGYVSKNIAEKVKELYK